MISQRFGMLLVIAEHPIRKDERKQYIVLCDCGETKIVLGKNLRNGRTKSCGCLRFLREKYKTHGKSHTLIYKIWKGMIYRCTNKASKYYHHYGGRNIKVCDKWLNDIQAFCDDMGDRPTNKHQLDRIDNNGDYCPENCRWALPVVNNNNKRNTTVLTYNGRTQSLADWAREMNIPYDRLRSRYARKCNINLMFKELNNE